MSVGKELMALALALMTVLLVGPPSTTLLSVSAQAYMEGGTTRTCGAASIPFNVKIDFGYGEYQRVVDQITITRRECPYNMVCAQKLTLEESGNSVYNEDCWSVNNIQEYTEVACSADLCNFNLTFGSYPSFSPSRPYFGSSIQCYNHGQLQNMRRYASLITDYEYQSQYRQPLPVSHWRNGMCGAAVYASNFRTQVVHERVLTGDSRQKFAMLRLCSSSGCDMTVLRDAISRGFKR